MTVEIGHIYIKNIVDMEKILLQSILEYKKLNIKEKNKVILVDDKEEKLNVEEQLKVKEMILNFLNKQDLFDVDIYFENDFQDKATKIIEKIDQNKIKKVFFRKSKKHVFFYKTINEEIPIYEINQEGVKHYCQILSLAWSVFKQEHYQEKNMLILPETYRNIEKQVNTLQLELFFNENYYIYH